ncbi:DAK2 domain-containing protein [Nocardioides mangrovicus]|uniref:DAK2 domain-containing protein n=1 Tax=Nocardioides mangrovicus TaxID=2478913 RepID=A0A3L8P8R9_9ACTN|nr:DAK2 domain-containing protein [Nocardioides mangrovicus]RLV51159.1 DAK2 domain-containing protein [Nocardioides mangrovicus]
MQHPFDASVLTRFADLAVDSLGAAREEIDALNVYPVPDGDTGTNMFLTLESARDALVERLRTDAELAPALAAYARGALLGARGNSGVILSELVGALVRRVSRARPGDRPEQVWAEALRAAADAAWAAVGTPVEGTILSVAAAAAEAAEKTAADPAATLERVVHESGRAAHEALLLTPDQLPLLRDAGVVDAGGRGLVVVLDAVEAVATGRRPPAPAARAIPVLPAGSAGDLSEEGPAYEVMYLLDAEEDRIPTLRAALAGLGDSLVVVGGEGLWNVHVHVDDVGAAVEAGIAAGTPRRIRVTHFAEQVRRAGSRVRSGRKVVVVAAGEGLATIFAEAGAVVVPGGPGRRPSTGELLAAITGCGAEEVIVLPNDHDSAAVAQAAARTAADQDVRVVVVPTSAQVQGIAAMAVHEPGRALEADVVAMTSAARHARHAAVTVATKRAMTSAGPCEPGDVLGAIEGDFVAVGDDLAAVARGLVDRLLDSGGELVTLVAGEGGAELVVEVEAHVERRFAGVDVVVYDGGQDRYPLLLAVE